MPKRREPALAAGVYAALLTARAHQSTETNVAAFLDYVDRVSKAGVDGLVLFGSTGEFIHYDIGERMRAVGLAVKRSRVPVLVNVSHSSLRGALELAEQAEDAGASGALLMPPYFFRYADQEIEQFYSDFLTRKSTSIPVYLYNLPAFGNGLSTELTLKLLRTGGFAGIKDSAGDWDSFARILAASEGQPVQTLVGNEAILDQGLSAGAAGVVSGIAAALPELPVAFFRTARSGASDRVAALRQRIDELLAWVNRLPAPVAIKYVADARGWIPVHLAVPLGPAACEQVRHFQAWLADWLPSTLEDCAVGAT